MTQGKAPLGFPQAALFQDRSRLFWIEPVPNHESRVLAKTGNGFGTVAMTIERPYISRALVPKTIARARRSRQGMGRNQPSICGTSLAYMLSTFFTAARLRKLYGFAAIARPNPSIFGHGKAGHFMPCAGSLARRKSSQVPPLGDGDGNERTRADALGLCPRDDRVDRLLCPSRSIVSTRLARLDRRRLATDQRASCASATPSCDWLEARRERRLGRSSSNHRSIGEN